MKRVMLAAALVAIGLAGAWSDCLAVAGAGGIVLEFPIGARYNAMGEAGVALAQDATATWWNPAGLAFMSGAEKPRDVQIMQSNLAAGLADDIRLYWLGYAQPMAAGALGVNLTYLDMGQQTATNVSGDITGTFKSYMFTFGAAFGTKLTQNLGVGIGAKYFRDKLADDQFLQDQHGGSGDSFGVDFGALYKVPSIGLNIATAVTNLGPRIQHVDADQSDPMPRKVTTGVAYSAYKSETSGLVLVADVLVPLVKWKATKNDYGFGFDAKGNVYGMGAEWSYVQSLFVRAGYENDNDGQIKAMTYGFGLDLGRWTGQAIQFGYASVPQATGLDRVNRFTLGYRF